MENRAWTTQTFVKLVDQRISEHGFALIALDGAMGEPPYNADERAEIVAALVENGFAVEYDAKINSLMVRPAPTKFIQIFRETKDGELQPTYTINCYEGSKIVRSYVGVSVYTKDALVGSYEFNPVPDARHEWIGMGLGREILE